MGIFMSKGSRKWKSIMKLTKTRKWTKLYQLPVLETSLTGRTNSTAKNLSLPTPPATSPNPNPVDTKNLPSKELIPLKNLKINANLLQNTFQANLSSMTQKSVFRKSLMNLSSNKKSQAKPLKD